LENGTFQSSGEIAFDPVLYPRSYRTSTSLTIVRGGYGVGMFSVIFVFCFFLRTAQGVAWFLIFVIILLVAALGLLLLFFSISGQQVELTATSLTVNRRFFKTRCIQRKDIAECSVHFVRMPRGGEIPVMWIRSRDSAAARIGLDKLNWDDAFWDWFSGIPGKRERPG
jgi:hypothetical protein